MAQSSPDAISPTTRASERLRDAERHRTLRFSWALLGSAWVHIVVVGVALVAGRCMPEPAADVAAPETAILLISPQDQDRVEASESSPVEPGPNQPSEADLANLDVQALLRDLDEFDPEAVEALLEIDLGALDPETLAALQQALDPELLAKLAAAAPPDDAQLAALSALEARSPAGIAQAPDADLAADDANKGIDAPAPDARESKGADPDDAVADASLPDPQERDQTPDEREEPEEPPERDKPEPDPEPEASQDPEFQRYLRTEETQRVRPSSSSEYISSRDTRAEELRRVEVTSEVAGPTTPPLDGLPIDAGTPSLDLADGDPDADGGDAPAAGEPVEERVPVEVGGGLDGEADGLGSPFEGQGKRGGAPSRSGRRAAATTSAIVLAGDDAPRSGSEQAPRPDDNVPSRQEGWWSPKVARMVVVAPDITPAEAPITAALALEQVAEAPEPRPDDRSDRGGTEQPVEVDEDLPESPDEAPEADTGEAEVQEEVEETPEEPVESIADLRLAMGWGGMEQARSKPRRSMPGIAATDGNLRTSKQTASAELLLDRVAVVDAVETPLAHYRASLDEEISHQWNAMDLSLHERALGIQGDVSVVFVVQRNGKVGEKIVTRSSGHASLDAMALAAVSDKLLKFPKDLERTSVVHQYNFIYRNPIIVQGGP